MSKPMVMHASKVLRRRDKTITTTLCGRSNRQSIDGMNIVEGDAWVTCAFCLRLLAKRDAAPTLAGKEGA